MASSQKFAVADVSGGRGVGAEATTYLEIEGVGRFDIVSFTSTFAVNEIPQAQCMLPVGRHAAGPWAGELAALHRHASQMKQMLKAKVVAVIEGDYSPDGTDWLGTEDVLFDGYYAGFAYRRICEKLQAVVHLIHWLVDLTCSSCLSQNSHPANPGMLTTQAIYEMRTGAADQGVFISSHVGDKVSSGLLLTDLWSGIKSLFCAIAQVPATPINPTGPCGPLSKHVKNDRALAALRRMEGPTGLLGGGSADCSRDYKFGVPLKPLVGGIPTAEQAISNAILLGLVQSYSGTTFWDKLVGEFCPTFNMVVIPLVDRALVVPDAPMDTSRPPWRTFYPESYNSFDQTASLDRPTRSVAVFGYLATMSGANAESVVADMNNLGGCFTVDSVSPADGMVMYVQPPKWLETFLAAEVKGPQGTGNQTQQPTNSSTSPGRTPPPHNPYAALLPSLRDLYDRFAQSTLAMTTLRGRYGSISGKLRFDIGPGSNVRIAGRAEDPDDQFQDDQLADTLFANVSRVTVTLNQEAPFAVTSFQLTHIRSEAENGTLRASTPGHPLFQRTHNGAPLIDAYASNEFG